MSAGAQFDPDAFMAQRQGFDPDAFMQQRQPGQPAPAAPNPSGPAGPSWLPQSMRNYIGQVDTSRYEQEQQKGWQPFQQMGEGAKQVITGPDMQARAGGAHKVLTGAMEAGAHLLPVVAPMNPLGTAAGIAAGTVAGVGTKAGLQAAGAPEEYSDLGGDVAGIVAGGLAGKGVSKLTGGGLVGADPETLSWQALQPRGGSAAHYNNAPVVMGDIKASAARRNLPIRSARELKGAIDSAELDNRDAFGQHWSQVKSRIPLDHIADLIDQTLDPETRRLASLGDPEAQAHVDAVHNYANTFRGQTVTPDEFRALQEHVNAEDDVFQKKSDEKQAKIIAARGGDPTIRAKASGYRDLVRQYAGDDAADLQTRYGLLRDWNAASQKAMDRALNEKAGTLLQKGAQAADVPGQLATGQLEKTPPLKGTTDQKIQWAFDRVKPGPPLPLPGQMPYGTPRQLGAPPLQMPPTPSYVSVTGGMPPGPQQNVWQGIGAPRQLPAGQAPFTQGTSAVNPSGMAPRGPTRGPYNAGLLGPGSPTQGQGVTPVPPPGAENVFTEGGPPLIQVPPRARGQNVAAAPADTSFVRGVRAQLPEQEPIIQRMSKSIWEVVKPAETAPAAAAPETPPPAPPPKPNPVKAPTKVDTRLEKALGVLSEGMNKIRQAPPGGSERGSFSNRPTRQSSDIDAALRNAMSDEGIPKTRQAPPGFPASRDPDWQQRYGQETPEVSKYLGHDLESRITNAYNKLDSGGGNTVTFYRLRQELPDVSKADFDQAVLNMTTGKTSPFLSSVHDSAHRMSASGQDVSDFVFDPSFEPAKQPGGTYANRETAPKGQYYVSMYKRPK